MRPGGGGPDTPGWTVRAFPNLYPALVTGAPAPEPEANPDLFAAQAAEGAHEVIVNAPEPVSSLSDLTAEQVATAVEAWRARMRAHEAAACRHLIVNERTEAGASLPHTHAQLFALGFVPAAIARERERFSAHAVRTMGSNLLGDLVQEEVRRRVRIVAIDDEAVLMAPWASQVPFQLMLAPRRPVGALRGRRALRRRAAVRRALAAAAAARRVAAAEPLGAHRAAGGRALLLAHRRAPAPRPSRRAGARRRGPAVHRPAGDGGRAAERSMTPHS